MLFSGLTSPALIQNNKDVYAMLTKKHVLKLANSPEIEQCVLEKKGKKLGYCRIKAGDWSKTSPPMAMMFLHGAGERGSDNVSQLFHVVPDLVRYIKKHRLKVLLICPQCPEERRWVQTPWDSLKPTMPKRISPELGMAYQAFLMEAEKFAADTSRFYLAGISMGGYGTWDLLSRHGEIFAAAIPVCGGGDVEQAEKLSSLPLNVFHGAADEIVPVRRSRDMVKALRKAGNCRVIYHEYDSCDHNVWDYAAADSATWDWLFTHKLEREK